MRKFQAKLIMFWSHLERVVLLTHLLWWSDFSFFFTSVTFSLQTYSKYLVACFTHNVIRMFDEPCLVKYNELVLIQFGWLGVKHQVFFTLFPKPQFFWVLFKRVSGALSRTVIVKYKIHPYMFTYIYEEFWNVFAMTSDCPEVTLCSWHDKIHFVRLSV